MTGGEQIAVMLSGYEANHHTGMTAAEKEIYQYMPGYPYLVSEIGKLWKEKLP